MSRKDYEAIAGIIQGNVLKKQRLDLANRLADYFESENPRFNRDRFLEACGCDLS